MEYFTGMESKLSKCGRMVTRGHYSNLTHVLVCAGNDYPANYRGDVVINGRQMAKFDVLGEEIFTANVASSSAIAWNLI
jgi:hypothetical protein